MDRRHEVIYDADCGICQATRRKAEALDRYGRFAWTPLQDDEVYRRHPALTREACEIEIHVAAADGQIYRGYEGMRFIAEGLPALAWIGPILHLRPVAWAGRVVYRWVAANRRRAPTCGSEASAVGTEASRWHKVSASVLIVALVGLKAWAIVGPYEDWPFTSAPIFAYYVAPGSPVYDILFHAEDTDGRSWPIRSFRDLGMGELSFKRLFFGKYYGSTDPRYPDGHHPNDTPEAFAARLGDFCGRLAAVMARRGRAPVAIRIEVHEVAGKHVAKRRVVGRYDVEAKKFVRFLPL